jgi:hypothetical protein
MSHSLNCRRIARDRLSQAQVERMFELMRANYDQVSEENFAADLAWKDEVLVLFDDREVIQGFSTLALNPKGCGTAGYDILYSGDTIINPTHWGNQELVRGFCHAAGSLYAERGKTLYWYLLSKGYRTYLYLPLFTHEYFPRDEATEEAQRLRSIADGCSRLMFGEAWKPAAGVLKFASSQGQLKPELADDTQRRAGHRHVDFFLKHNPGFAEGDELVCLAELSPENTRRIAGRFFREGMEMVNHPEVALPH